MMSSLTATGRAATALGVAAAGAAGAFALMLWQSDTLLKQSYEAALAVRTSAQAPPEQAPAATGAGLWLSRLDAEQPSGAIDALAAGDRITITGADGRRRELEVIGVHEVAAGVTRAEARGERRLELVTARVVGEPVSRVVRFLVEGEEAEAGAAGAKPNRSL
jgi:hypothetical protein